MGETPGYLMIQVGFNRQALKSKEWES